MRYIGAIKIARQYKPALQIFLEMGFMPRKRVYVRNIYHKLTAYRESDIRWMMKLKVEIQLKSFGSFGIFCENK